jgi:hypothetical protein
MSADRVTEFFITGAGTLPGFMFWAGDPGLAMVLFVPLLIAGCLAATMQQDAPFRSAGDEAAATGDSRADRRAGARPPQSATSAISNASAVATPAGRP